MINFVEATKKFTKNVMSIMAGVLCLFSLAILLGNEYRWSLADQEFRQVIKGGFVLFLAALPFTVAAYGLATKRWWANHLSLILTAAVSSPVVFDFSPMRSPIGPIFWLMTFALLFAIYLRQIWAWASIRKQQIK